MSAQGSSNYSHAHWLQRAAELLEEDAECIKSAHTIGGQWDDEEPEVYEHYREQLDAAQAVRNALEQLTAHETRAVSPDEGFQACVYDWMAKCFMRPDSMLPVQRSFRFVEEALELAQASGTSREEALRLVEYVYGRPAGLIGQEIGGVMVTLSGLATSFGLSMEYAGNAELARCEENTEKIRAKDLAKPQRSPLPGPPSEKALEQREVTK